MARSKKPITKAVTFALHEVRHRDRSQSTHISPHLSLQQHDKENQNTLTKLPQPVAAPASSAPAPAPAPAPTPPPAPVAAAPAPAAPAASMDFQADASALDSILSNTGVSAAINTQALKQRLTMAAATSADHQREVATAASIIQVRATLPPMDFHF